MQGVISALLCCAMVAVDSCLCIWHQWNCHVCTSCDASLVSSIPAVSPTNCLQLRRVHLLTRERCNPVTMKIYIVLDRLADTLLLQCLKCYNIASQELTKCLFNVCQQVLKLIFHSCNVVCRHY